jgi:hypothetical protein
MAGDCGNCTACCKVFSIAELAKTAGDWCKHCTIGKGCKIYDARPPTCVEFKCLWLESQSRANPREHMPAELRPDRCKVVISATTNERIISAITLTGMQNAWRHGKVRELIDALVHGGLGVVIGPANATRKTMVVKDPTGQIVEREARLTPPDENGMQWSI